MSLAYHILHCNSDFGIGAPSLVPIGFKNTNSEFKTRNVRSNFRYRIPKIQNISHTHGWLTKYINHDFYKYILHYDLRSPTFICSPLLSCQLLHIFLMYMGFFHFFFIDSYSSFDSIDIFLCCSSQFCFHCSSGIVLGYESFWLTAVGVWDSPTFLYSGMCFLPAAVCRHAHRFIFDTRL